MRKALGPFLFALVACSCGPQREREPNDDYASATQVRPGRVQGTLSGPKDADIYRLELLEESAVLSLSLGGIRDADFVLSVRDKDRRELKRCDETAAGGDEEALDIGLRQGFYYIVVSNKNEKADNPSQAYAMQVKLEKAAGHESEPNDSPQTAGPLELPGVTRGHYFPSKNLLSGDTDYVEQDWFRIDIATGLFLLNLDLSEVPKVDPVIEIYDSNGYKVKEVDSGGIGEGESLKNFGVRGPIQYRMRLAGKYRMGNPDAPYEILSEFIPYQGKTEFEPDDQRADATPFEGESIAGTIAPQGDADWYQVAVKEEGRQILRASLSGIEGMDLALGFADELGNPLVAADNMGKGQPEVLTGIGATKGDYYLVVSEKSGRKADNRSPYTLTKALAAFQPGLEYEVNDATAAAQPIKIGESVDGYIAPKGDADFYQFNVYQKGRVFLELAGILNVQFALTLYDQEDRELQAWTAPKAGEALSFEKELEAGTYFLRLRATDPAQSNVRDKYSLRLKIR